MKRKTIDTSAASPMPNSKGPVLDRSGIETGGYLDKKGAPAAPRVTPTSFSGDVLNRLPPGTDIEDQHLSAAETSAKRLKELKEVDEMSYPNDGWTNK